jgi:hypothetical protein
MCFDVVGQAELAGGLVASAHAHPELERDDVHRAMPLGDQDDAVREHLTDWFRERDGARSAHGGATSEPQQREGGCGARRPPPHQLTPLSA